MTKNNLRQGSGGQAKKPAFIRPSWDAYFMALAKMAASRSTCLSRPTGCVIVREKQILSTGYNGSMPGVVHCSDEGICYRRSIGASDDGKYDYCRSIHAEANAIALAARQGVSVKGATVYSTLFPCYVCTKLMASAGISEIVFELSYESWNKERDKHWNEATKQAGLKLREYRICEQDKKFFEYFMENETSKRRLKSE